MSDGKLGFLYGSYEFDIVWEFKTNENCNELGAYIEILSARNSGTMGFNPIYLI